MTHRSEHTEEETGGVSLSYKFQRLREQLRTAILNGELGDRLPGERELGRRYHANAKTINKALCDLSSEGLLVRQIGRGTFVSKADSNAHAPAHPRTWRAMISNKHQPGRQRFIEAIRNSLPNFDSFEAHDLAQTGDVALSAWPVSTRSKTDGVLLFPADPLTTEAGRPSAQLIGELWRRHVMVVLVGAASTHAKLTAVIPDYVDAGFRLTEYLIGLGCTTLVALTADHAGPEAERVYVGAQTAGARHRISVGRATPGNGQMPQEWSATRLRQDSNGSGVTGLLCVGAAAFEGAMKDPQVTDARRQKRVAIACILEPGATTSESEQIAFYQVDPERMAKMAAQLLVESRPADRPIEVIIPGHVVIGESSLPATPAASRNGSSSTHTGPGELAEVRV